MEVLLVHAHPEPQSFCAALKDVAVQELQSRNHRVHVEDLYRQRFKAVADADDFLDRSRKDYLAYAIEQRHGLQSSTLSPDILRHVAALSACDLLLLNFPLFWFSTPAILKGWIDRIFVSGLCYGGKRFYDKGGLIGKRALIAVTLGGRDHMFGADAVHGELQQMLKPLLRGTLQYVGFEVLEPFFAYHVPYVGPEARAEMLDSYRSRLAGLDRETPIGRPSLNDFDDLLRPRNAEQKLGADAGNPRSDAA